MRTARCEPSPVRLNIEIGAGFLLAMLERFGVAGWNAWIEAMLAGEYMPLGWSEHEPEPPVWFSLDFEGADFSGRNLDGIDLGLAWLRHARFDGASLVGSRIGCCPLASFRAADLRSADFGYSDITASNFRQARLDGIRLERTSYDPRHPPLGLPDRLLRRCKAESGEDGDGTGAADIPVPIAGWLTATGIY